MGQETLWFGYLEAGEKSSPVVMDPALNTGNPKTLYLFNYKRGQILEYARNIVESKLRELTEEEAGMIETLEAAFQRARKGFKPRAASVFNVSPPMPAAPTEASEEDEEALELEEEEDYDEELDYMGNEAALEEDEDAPEWEEG